MSIYHTLCQRHSVPYLTLTTAVKKGQLSFNLTYGETKTKEGQLGDLSKSWNQLSAEAQMCSWAPTFTVLSEHDVKAQKSRHISG